MSAAAVAEEFFDAWTGGDFQRARDLLHDDGFHFEGPIDTFDDRDAVPSSRIAEWYSVRDERIARMLVLFDARPFAALFEDARQP
jgi:hypothetical protein